MEPLKKILTQKINNNVNNDSKKIPKTVNNVNSTKEEHNTDNDINVNGQIRKSRFALNRAKFKPNNEKTQLAEEIAIKLGDLNNYAFYLSVVNKIGCQDAMRLIRTVESDIDEKQKTKTPVKSAKKYFTWIYLHRKY